MVLLIWFSALFLFYVFHGNVIFFSILCCIATLCCINHKSSAILERLVTDARNTVGNRYAREASAIFERIIAYARDAVWDNYALEVIAMIERRIAYLRNNIGYDHITFTARILFQYTVFNYESVKVSLFFFSFLFFRSLERAILLFKGYASFFKSLPITPLLAYRR